MGLWKRVQRCIAAGVLTAAPFLPGSPSAGAQSLESRVCVANSKSSDKQKSRAPFDPLRIPFEPFLPYAAGASISLAALGAAHVVYRLRKKKPSLLQPIAEHPFATAVVVGVSYGLFWSLIGFYASHILSYVKPPYVPNLARFSWLGLKESFEPDLGKKYELLNKMREACSLSLQPAMDADLIDNLFQQEKVDEALDLLKRLVSNIGPEKNRQLVETMLVSPLGYQVVALLEGKKHPFSLMYGGLFQGKVDKAFKHLDGFVEKEPSPSRHAARAYVVQAVSDLWPRLRENLPSRAKSAPSSLDEYAQRYWNSAIAAVLNDSGREQNFRHMGESRNEVLEYAMNKFLQGLLVFKRCDVGDGGRLRRERENILALKEVMKWHMVESLAYLEHEGKSYHVLRHRTNRTLENVLTENYDYDSKLDVWCQAARVLARIHKSTACAVDDSPVSEGHYVQRLEKVCYDQLARRDCVHMPSALRESLGDVGLRVGKGLAGAPLGFYKDANWRNWLVEENGAVIAIDFEHNVRMPVQLDLVSLLESGPLPVQRQVTEYELQGVVNKEVNVVNEEVNFQPVVHQQYLAELGRIGVDYSVFSRQYGWAAFQRHLEFAGYRARDREYERVRFHIIQAGDYAQKLGESEVAGLLAEVRVHS